MPQSFGCYVPEQKNISITGMFMSLLYFCNGNNYGDDNNGPTEFTELESSQMLEETLFFALERAYIFFLERK